ncbi:hypothetical protein [Psychrobacter sp. ANT_WB68]|uniref:hypothetical protein n=1 Tax=Psychrobacter sp. ANT_WB68 TaxID=2597355 RepID=UPI0011F0B901|nr:hypothetical protein [Psychrobacter sp. ANT_WB68]KAA0914285.1 hypothetical protein FQ084_06850 [Psychrobacter sp. ANT_WB68]
MTIRKLTLDDLLDQLEQARQIAIDDRKPSAMIQATATMAKLIGLDKPVLKDVYADNKPVVFNITGISANDASQAYKNIMG